MAEIITSTSNPRVKAAVKLRESKNRRKQGKFIIDAARDFRRALAAGIECEQIFFDEETGAEILMPPGTESIECSAHVMAHLAYRDNHDGFIAIMHTPPQQVPEKLIGDFFLILDGVEKPGNVGALLRSASAAGVHAVLIDHQGKYDLYNPNCIRASTGAVFTLPVYTLPHEAVLEKLNAADVTVYSATPEAEVVYSDIDYTGASAFVMGAEAEGVSERWKEAADQQVMIPTQGVVDSLNVSVTAGVLMFEVARQRWESHEDSAQ